MKPKIGDLIFWTTHPDATTLYDSDVGIILDLEIEEGDQDEEDGYILHCWWIEEGFARYHHFGTTPNVEIISV